MWNSLSVFIGLRYSATKQKQQFISFVSLISLLGMILGVFSLVVVLSVMNGFEEELKSRLLSVLPHAYISHESGELEDWQRESQKLVSYPEIKHRAPYVESEVMLSRMFKSKAARLMGVDPSLEMAISPIEAHITEGSFSLLKPGEYRIVLGEILAHQLGLSMGDKIDVVLPKVTITPLGLFPRVKRFVVSGTFAIGAELDSQVAYIHINDAQKLLQLGYSVTGLQLKFDDIYQAPKLLPTITESLGEAYTSKSWKQSQAALFQAMKMEKVLIALMLMIIVLIAVFNIVSILTMMVSDKRGDIAVLRTMGASPKMIRQIFVIQGMTVGVIGLIIGLLLAIPVAMYIGDIVRFFENLFGVYIFDPQVFFISEIPSRIEGLDIAVVVIFGLLLSLLATIIPANKAAHIEPADVLRYE